MGEAAATHAAPDKHHATAPDEGGRGADDAALIHGVTSMKALTVSTNFV